jgi:hypothetical protein
VCEDGVAEGFYSLGVRDVICVLADEPGGVALIEEVVESGDEALGRAFDDAQAE